MPFRSCLASALEVLAANSVEVISRRGDDTLQNRWSLTQFSLQPRDATQDSPTDRHYAFS